MKLQIDNRLLGLFLLGALGLAVTLVLMFGNGSYFGRSQQYVAYFEGSVNGLNTGAPVKLKGVAIGRVKDILVKFDTENSRVLTPVIVEIDLNKVMATHGGQSTTHTHPSLRQLIEWGLRARLSMPSLVTGQIYVDINFTPEEPGTLVNDPSLDLPEIPTLASSRDEIEKTFQKLVTDVREIPLKETVAAALGTLQHIENLLARPEITASVTNLNQALLDLHHLSGHLDSKLDPLAERLGATANEGQLLLKLLNRRLPTLLDSLDKSLATLTQSLDHAKGALTATESLASPGSELNNALRDVSTAARAIRVLTESLEEKPESLLYGKPQGSSPD